MRSTPVLLVSAVLATGAAVFVLAQQNGADPSPPNAPDQKPAFTGQTRAPVVRSDVAFDVVTVAEKLENPWALAFLPDRQDAGDRAARPVASDSGRRHLVSARFGYSRGRRPWSGWVARCHARPGFAKNGLIYWSYAEPQEGGVNNTAVARGKLVDDAAAPRVENVQVIYHQAPTLNSRLHFGSRLVFGRDGTLFVTQGDRSITEGRMQAQKMDSLLGKIVRINTDGTIPKDNPFVGKDGVRSGNLVVGSPERSVSDACTRRPASSGRSNTARAAAMSSISSRKGKDYGWPTIAYGIEYRGGTDYRRHHGTRGDGAAALLLGSRSSGPAAWCSTPGAMFPAWKGNLFVGGHQTRDLVRLVMEGDRVTGEERLLTDLTAAAGAAPRRSRGARRCDLRRHRQRDGSRAEVGGEEVT